MRMRVFWEASEEEKCDDREGPTERSGYLNDFHHNDGEKKPAH